MCGRQSCLSAQQSYPLGRVNADARTTLLTVRPNSP